MAWREAARRASAEWMLFRRLWPHGPRLLCGLSVGSAADFNDLQDIRADIVAFYANLILNME